MTSKVYIGIKCRKNVYLGHRRFLPTNHQCRKKGKHFKGEADHRKKHAIRIRTGDHILPMVNDLQVIFGKGPGGLSVPNDDEGRAPMWKKKSMFWDLPYWKDLEVSSAIDVMHMTKNLCVALLGFFGVPLLESADLPSADSLPSASGRQRKALPSATRKRTAKIGFAISRIFAVC